MMTERGHTVYLYSSGPDRNDAPCEECIEVSPPPETAAVTELEWTADRFRIPNGRTIAEISERIEPHDIICLIAGKLQQPIAGAFAGYLVCEYGVGYSGTFADYRVWESYAWMHATLGAAAGIEGVMSQTGRFYDTVIPNYFEPEQFPFGDGKGDYLLYVGRMIPLKGLAVAEAVAKRTGLPIKWAGQGEAPEAGEYVGVVGPEERAELMGGARCLLAPTQYLEPFGGVAVEAQMCGTPVLASDWGAFTETVEVGVSGYRPRTLNDWASAATDVLALDRETIRQRAVGLYSSPVIALRYEKYFEALQGLFGKGWDASPDEVQALFASTVH